MFFVYRSTYFLNQKSMGVAGNSMDKVYPHIVEPEPQSSQQNPSRSCPDLSSKLRKPTDVCFLTVFAMFFVVLFFLIGYCMCFGDINRIINGYDHCGSVCGKIAKDDSTDADRKNCYKSRQNTFGPYQATILVGKNLKSICIDNCTTLKYETFFNRCLPDKKTGTAITKIKSIIFQVYEDFQIYWKQLVHLCALSLVMSLVILLLLQFCVEFIIWLVLICTEIACIGASVALWVYWIRKNYSDQDEDEKNSYLFLTCALGATILAILVGLVIFFLRKKIDLIIQLFKEAGKAISFMPELLAEPLLTFCAFAATISCWIYFCLWIASSGHLTPRDKDNYHYKKDGWMKATAILNVLGMLWMIQFITACQNMIIAGAVSKWYFTRDKSKLQSPVTESAYNLTRYHLGSVALGSGLEVVIALLRTVVKMLQKLLNKQENSFVKVVLKVCLCWCNCCLQVMQWIAHIFASNAYIIIAMYGHSFFKAGRQAMNRISAHPLTFAAINSVGDFVLLLAKIMVFAVTETAAVYVLKGKGVQYPAVFLVLVGVFSFCVAHYFITLYEMTIDTIFICFCEDSELNDGVSKPYYMSRELMEYVENSKRALEIYDKRKIANRKSKLDEIQSVSLTLETKDQNNKI